MLMNDIGSLLLTGLAGVGLGLLFFGGLWYTIRRLPTTSRPVFLLLVSFVVRASLTLAGFYLLMGGPAGEAKRLLVALVGFFLVRLLLTRQLRPTNSAAERGKS